MASGPPGLIVPVPASQFSTLRGRRVIVGVPGRGFRPDLRADDAVVHGSRTYVPVLSEVDYYRAEMEQLEVFAPLVPIDRVWVEDVRDGGSGTPIERRTLDAPAPRVAVPIASEVAVMGRRVVQAVPDGHIRDLRACTDVYLGSDGGGLVRICVEADWYRWALQGTTPGTTEASVNLLWIE